jgi:hypothetical protein
MNFQKIALLSGLIIAGMSATGVQAATWSWSYSGTGVIGGSGTFTTNDAAPFVVTGITGNAEGSKITGLYPAGTGIYEVPINNSPVLIDNSISATEPQLSYNGLGFATEALTFANNAGLVLYYNDGSDILNPIPSLGLFKFTSNYGNAIGAWTDYVGINFVATEVPEPLNVLGSVTGVVLFGSLTNVLKRKNIK